MQLFVSNICFQYVQTHRVRNSDPCMLRKQSCKSENVSVRKLKLIVMMKIISIVLMLVALVEASIFRPGGSMLRLGGKRILSSSQTTGSVGPANTVGRRVLSDQRSFNEGQKEMPQKRASVIASAMAVGALGAALGTAAGTLYLQDQQGRDRALAALSSFQANDAESKTMQAMHADHPDFAGFAGLNPSNEVAGSSDAKTANGVRGIDGLHHLPSHINMADRWIGPC